MFRNVLLEAVFYDKSKGLKKNEMSVHSSGHRPRFLEFVL